MKLRKVVFTSILMASQLALSAPLKKAILVVPGSFIKAEAYDSLVEEIETALGESLLIEKTSFLGDFPTKTGVIESLKNLKAKIENDGFEADITVLAHSQGGLSANGLSKDLAARVVRMASYQRADWFKKQSKELIPYLNDRWNPRQANVRRQNFTGSCRGEERSSGSGSASEGREPLSVC